MPVETATREELIAQIMWADPESGNGYGICGFGAAMLWEMQRPGPGKPDWISVVTVKGPTEKYTDEELEKLVAFSIRRTGEYDRLFNVRMGANLTIIDKCEWHDNKWLRKRMSWEFGPMYSDTLDEALEFMRR